MPADKRTMPAPADIERLVREYVRKALNASPLENAWTMRNSSIEHMQRLSAKSKDLKELARRVDALWFDDEADENDQNDLSEHIQEFVNQSLRRAYAATKTLSTPESGTQGRAVGGGGITEGTTRARSQEMTRATSSTRASSEGRIEVEFASSHASAGTAHMEPEHRTEKNARIRVSRDGGPPTSPRLFNAKPGARTRRRRRRAKKL